MSLKFAIATLLGFIAVSPAMADQMGPNGDKFYEESAHYENACHEEPCKAPYSHKILYKQDARLNELSAQQRDGLKAVAKAQAQIWGDTILEGDYIASGRIRLDQVLGFYKKNRLIGYKIQYSEKAWYLAECNYQGKRENLKECKTGRIVEGSYVSADMKTYFSDEERYAEFAFIKD